MTAIMMIMDTITTKGEATTTMMIMGTIRRREGTYFSAALQRGSLS